MTSPILQHFGVGSIPWSPLARGFLARPLTAELTKRGEGDKYLKPGAYGMSEGNKLVNKKVEELAQKKGATMAQIACAWVMQKEGA